MYAVGLKQREGIYLRHRNILGWTYAASQDEARGIAVRESMDQNPEMEVWDIILLPFPGDENIH